MPKHVPSPPNATTIVSQKTASTTPTATETISANIVSRRSLLIWSFTAGIAACNKTANSVLAAPLIPEAAPAPTPRQTEGPFYPIDDQYDKDNDLTRIDGNTSLAQGEQIIVHGRITDTHGKVITNAFVEIWQANTWGRYRHARDPNAALLDPAFQGWGQAMTDAKGAYQFKTIKPGAYPAGPGWTRPPHIHFKVSSPGYRTLTTQMYFPGQPLNSGDLILQNVPPAQQSLVIAKQQPHRDNGVAIFRFDIVLLKKSVDDNPESG